MPKRCMPGVICIENITVVILLCILLAIVLFFYFTNKSSKIVKNNIKNNNNQSIQNLNTQESNYPPSFLQNMIPSVFKDFNTPSDILMNPYTAPLRDDRLILNKTYGDPRGIPINIQTQTVDTQYRQLGILTRVDPAIEMVLPLMGRPLYTNRDKWNFYTLNDKNNMIKLPITNKNKSCTSEYGCDNLYDGDVVRVEGLNADFTVTMYDNQVMRYIPFI